MPSSVVKFFRTPPPRHLLPWTIQETLRPGHVAMAVDTPKNHSFRFDEQIIGLRPLSNPVAPASLLLAPQGKGTYEAKEFHETFCALIEHFDTCRHVFFGKKKVHQSSVDDNLSRDFHVSTVLGFETLVGKSSHQQPGTSPAKKTIPSLQPYWMRLPDEEAKQLDEYLPASSSVLFEPQGMVYTPCHSFSTCWKIQVGFLLFSSIYSRNDIWSEQDYG